jgi:DNA-binding NtrC family response regulator
MHTVLLVEDEATIRFSMRRFLSNKGFEVVEAETCAAAEEVFRAGAPDVVLLDYYLPDGDGLDLLARLKPLDPNVPFVVLTAHGSIDLAVRAIKIGAEQFLTKPVELHALVVVIERLLENRRNQKTSLATRTRQSRREPDPFVGESPAVRRLAEQAHKLLASPSPVLILGETGTGKGVLASWLHRNGPRTSEAFIDLNCAGLSREFLESELFGHERGAFTGAVANKQGLLEIAHRGTLFLDEIGDLDVQVQPKLLKALEDQRFRRLGDARDRQVNVRLLAATHHDLTTLVREGRFRGDLYYRISTLPLHVPPLRERGRDVVLLARTLLQHVGADLGRPGASLTPTAEAALERYPWPGNVRELRNTLERALLHADGDRLDAADLLLDAGPGGPAAAPGAPNASSEAPALTLRQAERRHIEAVLRQSGGDVIVAASVLGLSRSALYQKIKKHRIALARP